MKMTQSLKKKNTKQISTFIQNQLTMQRMKFLIIFLSNNDIVTPRDSFLTRGRDFRVTMTISLFDRKRMAMTLFSLLIK